MVKINSCPDKSISHRAIMLSSLSHGMCKISNFLLGYDCLHTIDIFRSMGIQIDIIDKDVIVHGKGLFGLSNPKKILYCGNSGTTIRLVSGILSAQNFPSTITGDSSICKRPMKRIIDPLKLMNAKITSSNFPPISFKPSKLHSISYNTNASSAQTKSCIMLASLYCNSQTIIKENFKSRDHTERMLKHFGIDVVCDKLTTIIQPKDILKNVNIDIPNDISSVAFFAVAAIITKDLKVSIDNVGINPTRCGILEIFRKSNIIFNTKNTYDNYEPSADLEFFYNDHFNSFNINKKDIPSLIDEIPILSLLAARADGISVFNDLQELTVKESNRLNSIYESLKKMGCDISIEKNKLIINGSSAKLESCHINTNNDHRIAMMALIANLICEGNITIDNYDCIKVSYPNFFIDYYNVLIELKLYDKAENFMYLINNLIK